MVPRYEQLDKTRVETLIGLLNYDFQRFVDRKSAAVLAVAGECIKAIDYRQDSCADRYFGLAYSVRIAGTIPLLMMAPDDGNNGVRKLGLLENVCSHHRMDFYLFEFLGR